MAEAMGPSGGRLGGHGRAFHAARGAGPGRLLASLAGVRPRVTHEADSLELVDDLIVAGLGVGLLPLDRVVAPGVRVLPLTAPEVGFCAYCATRPGHAGRPPLALVLDRLRDPR